MSFKRLTHSSLLNISNEIVGKQIRIYRHARNLSQERLGYKVRMSYQQIQKYEAGKSPITLSMFLRLCGALEIEPQDFLHELKRAWPIAGGEKDISPPLMKVKEEVLSLIHGAPSHRLILIHQILHLLLKKDG